MSININITFMHISRFILVSKSISFTFFIWIFAYIITLLHGRFVYIHTFFHHKIMRGCRLSMRLYNIRRTSYGHSLYHSHVAPFELIWAKFIFTLNEYTPSKIFRQNSATAFTGYRLELANTIVHTSLIRQSSDREQEQHLGQRRAIYNIIYSSPEK